MSVMLYYLLHISHRQVAGHWHRSNNISFMIYQLCYISYYILVIATSPTLNQVGTWLYTCCIMSLHMSFTHGYTHVYTHVYGAQVDAAACKAGCVADAACKAFAHDIDRRVCDLLREQVSPRLSAAYGPYIIYIYIHYTNVIV